MEEGEEEDDDDVCIIESCKREKGVKTRRDLLSGTKRNSQKVFQ